MKKGANIAGLLIFLVFLSILLYFRKWEVASACVVGMIGVEVWRRYDNRKKPKEVRAKSASTVDDLIAQYGQPDDIVVVNPLHANEAGGVVMVYGETGMLVIDGYAISRDDIQEVSLGNDAVPQLTCDYRLMITTRKANPEWISVPLGSELSAAMEVVGRLRPYLPVGRVLGESGQ
ncbi:hypothetical protein [Prevotella dentasini]|uniref:hypothetical protein n=1 Tax=Prevotella dentasini TaxID=589537 RepID=UPI00046A78F9|nr:hypothetical protein [Prevotella dentasini]